MAAVKEEEEEEILTRLMWRFVLGFVDKESNIDDATQQSVNSWKNEKITTQKKITKNEEDGSIWNFFKLNF